MFVRRSSSAPISRALKSAPYRSAMSSRSAVLERFDRLSKVGSQRDLRAEVGLHASELVDGVSTRSPRSLSASAMHRLAIPIIHAIGGPADGS